MNNEVFVQKYLERINIFDDVSCDLSTLKRIQKQHLLNIPFENLNVFADKRIEFDSEKLWMKIIDQKRGGICYELNGLLFELLVAIGFDVKFLGARVLDDGNEFDHVFLMVALSCGNWLVDVGFGDNFLEPIRLQVDSIQKDAKGYFKIAETKPGEYQLLKSNNNSEYALEYNFTLKERNLKDFSERCQYFETSSKSRFRKKPICSIEKENGRISLTDDKLVITEEGNQTIREIGSRKEFLDLLKKIFDIDIEKI